MFTVRMTLGLLLLMTPWISSIASADPTPSPVEPNATRQSSKVFDRTNPIFGFNYFDPFIRLLHDANDQTVERDFKALKDHRIPFIRFAACGYWPSEMKLYVQDRNSYLARMDHLFAIAEKHGIGLIPSLFWFRSTVPDLVGESCDQWGNKHSKTNAFMRQYTADIVQRYHRSPAIWGWGLGNEYNLDKDLPPDPTTLPPIVPALGTPSARSERDRLSHDGLVIALNQFADAVREIDKVHFITTGNAVPRASAWHLWKEKSWSADSEDQFARMLLEENPSPFVISVHLYKDDLAKIQSIGRIAQQANRALFIGEFQIEPSQNRKVFEAILRSMTDAQVTIAAVWVYDLASQRDTLSVTPGNDRAYQLHAIQEMNNTPAHSAIER